jgi:hypothetical protein
MTHRLRYWIELAMASITGLLTVLTLVWHDWIEIVFGADPDGGSGEAEWGFVAVLLAVTVVFALAARRERGLALAQAAARR